LTKRQQNNKKYLKIGKWLNNIDKKTYFGQKFVSRFSKKEYINEI